MASLRARDLRAALDVVTVLAGAERPEDVASAVAPALTGLLHADGFLYHDSEVVRRGGEVLRWRVASALPTPPFPGHEDLMCEHPLVRRADDVLQRGALRLSDVETASSWRSSRLYGEALRAEGVDDQVTSVLERSGDRWRTVTCYRAGTPFTERERDLLALLRPQLRAGLRRLLPPGRPRPGTGAAPALPAAPAGSELTAREDEVMALLARGCTSGQIGRAVGCSARTVEKHLEHVYAKLRVTNRVEAVQRWSPRGTGGAAAP
ncbi:regulatory LuxR family protein [Kineococcus xinjiangensis]|uniref:Regulatory LuxR family protein n=1 Tax=Kineococcus xinjiangensis TaxID=512762 RepID=A0A2S6ITK0_9ACTN|nr:helix-turn-helix transcriptional regulator [Kineococcus xinjiangensis]PPK97475.1 regulatory LuxR family protein [Kineococcus xinjiangensis]